MNHIFTPFDENGVKIETYIVSPLCHQLIYFIFQSECLATRIMAGNFWKSSHYEEWLLNPQELELGRREDCEVLTKDQLLKLHIFYANFIQTLGEHALLRQQVHRATFVPLCHLFITPIGYSHSFCILQTFLREEFSQMCRPPPHVTNLDPLGCHCGGV